jgi:hypothetical protein
MGLDATIPWKDASGRALSQAERDGFRKVAYGKVNLSQYLP